ncbi:MAG: hypothetical protein FRX48_08000 [Lasallia pustulata]|uniref:Uncharacterized protein n=1 Tax=Lasallia pustulata TaxID=136370 RepID=A0A5M8PH01_9LECA|nr:MAG: hypothetical protein FRX48_08000 [Lasallia pustulata]
MLPTTLLTVAWLAQIVAAWPQDSSSRIVGHELFAAVLHSVSNLVGPARDISNSRATPPSPQPSATTSSGAATAMASGTTTTPATTSSEKPSDTLTTISTIPSATTKFGNKVNKIATQIQPSSAPATTVSSTTTSLPPSANAIIVNISTTLLLTPTSIPITLSSLADPETPPDTTNPFPTPPIILPLHNHNPRHRHRPINPDTPHAFQLHPLRELFQHRHRQHICAASLR